jgi:hypothetical protein
VFVAVASGLHIVWLLVYCIRRVHLFVLFMRWASVCALLGVCVGVFVSVFALSPRRMLLLQWSTSLRTTTCCGQRLRRKRSDQMLETLKGVVLPLGMGMCAAPPSNNKHTDGIFRSGQILGTLRCFVPPNGMGMSSPPTPPNKNKDVTFRTHTRSSQALANKPNCQIPDSSAEHRRAIRCDIRGSQRKMLRMSIIGRRTPRFPERAVVYVSCGQVAGDPTRPSL